MFALLAVFAIRAWKLDQPIWEGYIGRQVPTAMVARNLVRNGDFLHPQVDTGPFPNWFLVEPPIAAGLAAAVSHLSGWPLETSGRLLSALAMTLAGWGLFGLVARSHRQDDGNAPDRLREPYVALGLFALFPVSIRYGRAFQPDALMLGLTVAGLRLCVEGRSRWGLLLTALGLATKVTGAFVLVPLVFVLASRGSVRIKHVWLAAVTLVPAALWYLHAGLLLASSGTGTSASAGIAANWWERISSLGSVPWLSIGRDLTLRAFTPVGFALVMIGLAGWRRLDQLWRYWFGALACALVGLAGKLHHEYYWLMAAPAFGAMGARGWSHLKGRGARVGLLILFVALATYQTRSTWSTPLEWSRLNEAAAEVRSRTDPDAIIVAPEALVYASDRRGCRLEWEPKAVARAAREWPSAGASAVRTAEELVAFYRREGHASYFADLQSEPIAPERKALHTTLRHHSLNQTLIDQPGGLLLIRLAAQGPP